MILRRVATFRRRFRRDLLASVFPVQLLAPAPLEFSLKMGFSWKLSTDKGIYCVENQKLRES